MNVAFITLWIKVVLYMFFEVLYLKDKTIHLRPAETKEIALERLYNILKDKRVYDRVDRTTVIKREFGMKDPEYIFGCPESLNVKTKFEKDLKKNKVEFEKGE